MQSGSGDIVSGQEDLDSTYWRYFYLEDVYRDQATFPNAIVETPGVLDPDTRKLVAVVGWNASGATKSKQIESYIYNY